MPQQAPSFRLVSSNPSAQQGNVQFQFPNVYVQPLNVQQPHYQQILSMNSPPIENLPPWRQNRPVSYNFSQNLPPVIVNTLPTYFDDRFTETPAPMPLVCELGQDTPSPSLSPPLDADELLRLAFAGDVSEETSSRKRRLSNEPFQPATKRHRRTKVEIIQDRNKKLLSLIRPCEVKITKLNLKESEFRPRVFVAPKNFYIVRTDLPRVPKMKIVPQEFQRIADIGFMRTQNGLIFSCLTEQCKFKCRSPVVFHKHVKLHERAPRLKFCSICKLQIDWRSPLFELEHLLRVHLIQVGIENIPVKNVFYSKVSKLQAEPSDEKSEETENENDDDDATDIENNDNPDDVDDDNGEDIENHTEPENDDAATIVPKEEPVDPMDTPINSPRSVKTEINEDNDINQLDDDFFELLDEAMDTLKKSDKEDTPVKSQDQETEETEKGTESFADTDVDLEDVEKDGKPSKHEDPDFDPNEVVESDEEVISKSDVTSDESKSSDSENMKNFCSTSDETAEDVPLGTRLRKRLRKSKKSKASRVRRRSLSPESTLVSQRPKRIIKKSDKFQKWRESREKKKHAHPEPNTECHEAVTDETESSISEEPKAKRSARTLQRTKGISSDSSSSESSENTQIIRKRKNLLTSDISSQETVASLSFFSTNALKNDEDEKLADLENIVETTNSKPDSDKENEAINKSPMVPTDDQDKNNEDQQSSVIAIEPNPVSTVEQPDRCEYLKNIPMSLIEKIKLAKTEQPTASEKGKFHRASLDQLNNEKSESLRSFSSEEPSRSPSKKKPQPTARKTTSVNRLTDQESLSFHKIKECRVMLSKLQETKLPKLLIKNATNPEIACVSTEIVPHFRIGESTNDSEDGNVSSQSTVDFDWLGETTKSTEKECVELSASQASDGGRIEIEYDENLNQQPYRKEPPKAMKDFPQVYSLPDEIFFDAVESQEPESEKLPAKEPKTKENSPDDCPLNIEPSAEVTSIVEQSNLSKLYPWIDNDIVERLFKSDRCAKVMLDEKSLYSTYKCMSIDCSYFTTSLDKFRDHIKKHTNKDKVFICSFCLVSEIDPDDLYQHLDECHKYDRYQCSACMYRSCEKFYCDIHRKMFHPNKKPLILKSATQKLLKKDRNAVQMKLKNQINRIKLKECRSKFNLRFCI